MQIVYLLHFIRPNGQRYKQARHAGHYIGFCERGLPSRLKYHRTGRGSPLMAAVVEKNDFVVALIRPGDRTMEKQMKMWKSTPKLCPICRGDAIVRRHPKSGKWHVAFKPGRRALYSSSTAKFVGRNPKLRYPLGALQAPQKASVKVGWPLAQVVG